MESITKSKLTNEQIYEMVKKGFGSSIKPEVVRELKDGYYNTAYMLVLDSGLKTVLKVSPPKDIQVMRYEKNIMEAEVEVLNALRSIGDIPVPKIFHYDSCKEIIDSGFFFMEFIEGVPLNMLRAQLTDEQYREISSELGYVVKKIHSTKGSYFGYIAQKEKQFSTWDEAFMFMIKELLEDAKDANVVLPYDYEKIYDMIEGKSNVLSTVKKSTLIHKDLWEGNIFIDAKTTKISGIIDCERAIYGDPLVELVFGFLVNNESFMKSYRDEIPFDRDEELRIILYRIYIYLILIIECSYRKYPDDNQLKWAGTQLEKAFDEL
jgi:aminoglycoside phosphotransferase (APT) family kinase protein